METRKVIDCRLVPDSHCTVSIAGTEDEIMPLALHHAIATHGYADSEETKEVLRNSLLDEKAE